ncbi:hypothetical protein HanRHA438_Chr16g0755001 [Helianthus annuus]|nr:hypothetical protein HanRHA438_Chr16g0755001 [Helianthus annuus]
MKLQIYLGILLPFGVRRRWFMAADDVLLCSMIAGRRRPKRGRAGGILRDYWAYFNYYSLNLG